jgi:tetratricopeptide (TPR) repeat protein
MNPRSTNPALKIIVSVALFLVLVAISIGGCWVLLPIYARPVSLHIAALADDAYAAGHYHQAVVDYSEASRLAPHNPAVLNNLAWLLATCPDASVRDGKRALDVATRACEMTHWNDAPAIDTLAAAYAETGDYANAVKWETKYLASLSLTPSDATDGQARLVLYQAHQPYHTDQ